MLLKFEGHHPELAAEVFVAPSATVLGKVQIGAESCVLYSAVVRGDNNSITIGQRSNVQDGAVLHIDAQHSLTIGDDVSIGHSAVIHGCHIADRVLVGMGAIVMNGAQIGEDCLIAAGCLISENTVIPPRSLVVGLPGKVKRELTDEEVLAVRKNAQVYVGLAKRLKNCVVVA